MRNYIFYFFYCQLSAFNFPKLPRPCPCPPLSNLLSRMPSLIPSGLSLPGMFPPFSSKKVESVGERRKEVACKAVVDRCDGCFWHRTAYVLSLLEDIVDTEGNHSGIFQYWFLYIGIPYCLILTVSGGISRTGLITYITWKRNTEWQKQSNIAVYTVGKYILVAAGLGSTSNTVVPDRAVGCQFDYR